MSKFGDKEQMGLLDLFPFDTVRYSPKCVHVSHIRIYNTCSLVGNLYICLIIPQRMLYIQYSLWYVLCGFQFIWF